MYGELKVHVFLSTGIFVYIYIYIKFVYISPEHFIRIINGSSEVLHLLSIVNISVF